MSDDCSEPSALTHAVVDRIVDGTTAVLLVEPDDTELTIPAADLPEGAADGTWLVLDRASDPVRVVAIDRELTERRRGDLAERMQRLRQERRGGRFERND